MKCNLVKMVTGLEKDGKVVKFTNFALLFDNDVFIPIDLKTYTTKSTDKKEVQRIEKINDDNWTKLNCMADLYEKK